MEYMLVEQSTVGFRNNRPPVILRFSECTKREAITYAKAVFDEVLKVGTIKHYGGDEVRINLLTIVGNILEDF